jgi:hypothetical protein
MKRQKFYKNYFHFEVNSLKIYHHLADDLNKALKNGFSFPDSSRKFFIKRKCFLWERKNLEIREQFFIRKTEEYSVVIYKKTLICTLQSKLHFTKYSAFYSTKYTAFYSTEYTAFYCTKYTVFYSTKYSD